MLVKAGTLAAPIPHGRKNDAWSDLAKRKPPHPSMRSCSGMVERLPMLANKFCSCLLWFMLWFVGSIWFFCRTYYGWMNTPCSTSWCNCRATSVLTGSMITKVMPRFLRLLRKKFGKLSDTILKNKDFFALLTGICIFLFIWLANLCLPWYSVTLVKSLTLYSPLSFSWICQKYECFLLWSLLIDLITW
jgi:hypothetical protein